jgi:hypothetical protein
MIYKYSHVEGLFIFLTKRCFQRKIAENGFSPTNVLPATPSISAEMVGRSYNDHICQGHRRLQRFQKYWHLQQEVFSK